VEAKDLHLSLSVAGCPILVRRGGQGRESTNLGLQLFLDDGCPTSRP
jgi:hypothetical protein